MNSLRIQPGPTHSLRLKPEGSPELRITTQNQSLRLVHSGMQGPRGLSGLASFDLAAVAGQLIPGHRAVFISTNGKAMLADPSNAGRDAVCGLSLQAAALDGPVQVRTAGDVEDQSFAWDEGPVWLGPNGTLTQIIPGAGSVVRIGTAIGATKILIHPRHEADI